MEPLLGLRELARIDRLLADLSYQSNHLPEHAEVKDVDSQVAQLGKDFGDVDTTRRPLIERRDAIESLVRQQRGRRDELSTRLSASTGGGKELEAMASEIAHLDASLDSLETEEIEILWQLEPLDDTVQRIKSEAASAAQRRESLVEAISAAQARLATEIASLQARRSELLPDIPSAVLALYEKILIKVRDVAAVELVDGICGGCKIAGVAMDIGRWRTSTVDSLVTCPACTRLWIPAS